VPSVDPRCSPLHGKQAPFVRDSLEGIRPAFRQPQTRPGLHTRHEAGSARSSGTCPVHPWVFPSACDSAVASSLRLRMPILTAGGSTPGPGENCPRACLVATFRSAHGNTNTQEARMTINAPGVAQSASTGTSAVASATQEAQETPAVTRQEATKGDRVAQRKLAKEQAAATAASQPNEAASSPARNTGRRVRVVA
jgi:hypothetical protein